MTFLHTYFFFQSRYVYLNRVVFHILTFDIEGGIFILKKYDNIEDSTWVQLGQLCHSPKDYFDHVKMFAFWVIHFIF